VRGAARYGEAVFGTEWHSHGTGWDRLAWRLRGNPRAAGDGRGEDRGPLALGGLRCGAVGLREKGACRCRLWSRPIGESEAGGPPDPAMMDAMG